MVKNSILGKLLRIWTRFLLCSKRKNPSKVFGQNLVNLVVVCTPNRTRFLVTMLSYVFWETAWKSALVAPSFLMKWKKIGKSRHLLFFYFHRKFWIFKFRLVSVQISIFFVKTMHYKFQSSNTSFATFGESKRFKVSHH